VRHTLLTCQRCLDNPRADSMLLAREGHGHGKAVKKRKASENPWALEATVLQLIEQCTLTEKKALKGQHKWDSIADLLSSHGVTSDQCSSKYASHCVEQLVYIHAGNLHVLPFSCEALSLNLRMSVCCSGGTI
jgi:hypothetical protein